MPPSSNNRGEGNAIPRINILSKHVSELIAAGEVVERPASVVKELIENSIDAGATAVTVEIQNGGVSFIRVTDDGCGIAREDVTNAFVSHATSKLLDVEDLDRIATLGFRGEALASISAVSRVTMLTKTAQELAGTEAVVEGGSTVTVSDAGCPVGTTILVRDLFYNTPARMKFLKKDVAEGNAVAACVQRVALSHPEVSFRLIREQKTVLHTAGDASLLSCAYGVFGREFAAGLIETAHDYAGVSVKGLVSKPEESRSTRGMQHFFVNGRYVRTRTAMAALEEAFKGSIMVGRFPSCVLHIAVAYDTVDVNVHPAKIEVRFVNERAVFDAVYFAVKNALIKADMPPKLSSAQTTKQLYHAMQPPQPKETVEQQRILSAPPKQTVPAQQNPAPFVQMTAQEYRAAVISPDEPKLSLRDDVAPIYGQRRAAIMWTPPEKASPAPPTQAVVTEPVLHNQQAEPKPIVEHKPQPEQTPVRLIGEAFDTYILVQRGDDILVVDKHAAHERIIYERLKAQHRTLVSQTLLSPVTVTLPQEEYTAVTQSLAALEEMGFHFEDFGGGAILVREFPLELAKEDIAAVLSELADSLIKGKRSVTPHVIDELYHSIACRSAVKAHDTSDKSELTRLLDILAQNSELRHCPHGRPVAVAIEKKELEKRFGRV